MPADPDNTSTLSAQATFAGLDIRWTMPGVNPHAVAYTKVFRNTVSDSGSATHIADVGGGYYLDPVVTDTATTYYYWIQNVSVNGTVMPLIGPVSITSLAIDSEIVGYLTGAITSTQLVSSINTQLTLTNTTATNLATEIVDRTAGDAALSASIDALDTFTQETRDLLTAEVLERITADSDLTGDLILDLSDKPSKTTAETISGAWTYTVDLAIETASGAAGLNIKAVSGQNTILRLYEGGYLRTMFAFNATSQAGAIAIYDALGANGQTQISWLHDGATILRYAGSSTYRFETTATGAKSYGDLDAVNGFKENGVSLSSLYHRQNRGATVNGVRVLDATYVGTYNVSAQETIPTSVFFSPDGSRMFVYGQQADKLKCYDLATAWTITSGVTYNAALDSTNFNTAHSEATGQAVFIKEDGTKFWIVGTAQNTVYQYTMSTAWDPSTGTYDSKSLAVGNSGAETNTTGLAFSTDGTKMFTVGNVADNIYRFDMSTAWDVSTASTTPSQTLSIASQETSARGVRFSRDGRKMYVIGATGDDVNEYLLTTAWDLTTAVFQSSLSLSAASFTVPQDVFLSADGLHLYAVDSTAQQVAKYLVPSDGLEVVGPLNVTGLVTARHGIQSSHALAGVGYLSGAGGSVTQASSKSTGVTLNKVTGKITMNGAALGASTSVGFTLTNAAIAATDIVVVNIASGATADSYTVTVDAVAAGSCRISLRNVSGGSLSEAVVLHFAVIKAVAA